MDIQEIIQLLERIAEFLYQEAEGNCPYCGATDYPVCKNKKGYDEVKPEDAEEWRIDHYETCIVVSIDQTLLRLKQQPKATSIGNKIREIASKDILGQTKLVRDKDILNQAADRLDAWWKYINELKEEVGLLKQQPTTGDFTEKFNRIIEEAKSMFVVSQAMAKNSFDSTLQIPVEGETDNPDPLPDHEYSQQLEPTSLGNTIRRIANNSKCNETDRNIICQAADRLDAWWKYIGELKVQVKAKDELLFAYESVRAPKQPTAGDFTKRLRKFVKMYENEVPRRAEITFLEEACDIIDRAEARLKAMYAGDLSPESRLSGYKVITDQLRLRIDELKATIVKVKKGIKRDGTLTP